MRGRWPWHLRTHSTHTRVPQQLLPPPSTPPRMQGRALPTRRLSQAEGGVQQVQGGVDHGLGQALDGSLVTGTQQALTRVPGLCTRSKGRASWTSSLGIPRGNANPEAELPLCPAHTPRLPRSPHLLGVLHLFRGWVGPVWTPTPSCSHTLTPHPSSRLMGSAFNLFRVCHVSPSPLHCPGHPIASCVGYIDGLLTTPRLLPGCSVYSQSVLSLIQSSALSHHHAMFFVFRTSQSKVKATDPAPSQTSSPSPSPPHS